MPDPAIEAYNAGRGYTEPTSLWGTNKGKGKKVRIQVTGDPTGQMSKRTIDIVPQVNKKGWWGRMTGGKGVQWGGEPAHSWWDEPTTSSSQHRPMPQIDTPNPHSAAQGLAGGDQRPLPPIGGTRELPDITIQPGTSIPWRQKRILEKQAKEQHHIERKWAKKQAKEMEARHKADLVKRKQELRQAEKELKRQRKHPERNMPMPSAPTGIPPSSKAPPLPPTSHAQWMMIPPMEEFGVRRPFDSPGHLPQTAGGEWPMMSRTMTHALIDMGREERVHAIRAGTVWGGGWGGNW